MKKKQKRSDPEFFRRLKKGLLIMKCFLFFMLLSVLSSTASVYSQEKRFNIKEESITIKEVLEKIEGQSRFRFFYEEGKLNVLEEKNVDFKNNTIEEVLNSLFDMSEVNYKILENDFIILKVNSVSQRTYTGQSQQNKEISGKVSDSSGQPLPGVSVIVKGTTQGTVTNADGEYSLPNLPANTTLQFSFVGMKSQEVVVGSQASINVVMEEETIGIDEVVAIGYGSVKKSDLTGAVGSVQGTTISERQSTQLSQALQGAMAGVMVTRDNNAPGSTGTIRIRGITTIGENAPLVIVDGVPVSGINDVNPNDVENISVLKDAASASIYGSRAAAGVILITTKRAKSGDLKLNYNYEFGIEKPTVLPEFVNITRYLEMTNELRWNDNGNNDNEYPAYPKDIIDNYLSLNAENPDLYPNTDWMGLILNKTAPKQTHQLSISAGTKVIKTNASIVYDKVDGLFDGKKYERVTARFNNDIDINNYLSATFDLFYKRSIYRNPVKDPMADALMAGPIFPALWNDGRIAEGKSGNNIYALYKYGGSVKDWYNMLGGKISLDLIPIKGLKLSAIFSPSFNFNKGKDFRKKIPYYASDDPNVYVGLIENATSTKLNETRDDNYNLTSQFLFNYTVTFGSHNLNSMFGYESYYAFYESVGASSDQFQLTSFPYLDLGNENYLGNSGNAYENAYRSYFGRIMYNFKNRYFLQGNIRYDGSSRFDTDYRWGAFPSVSAGWVISEETFLQSLTLLSFLKLRASWGTLGNERIGNYPYQSSIGFYNALLFQGTNVVSAQTAAQTQYAIRDISWETTKSFDIGMDISFFNNKFYLTADYYKKVTEDMLLELEIPDYIGFDNPSQNTGKMNTKGWEVETTWNDKIGELNYSASFNLSDFKSVMGDLGGTEFLGSQIKKEGSEYNEWYGYKSNGLYQTQEEVDNSAKLYNSVKPGDIKYLDISGPDGVPDGIISPEYDRTLLGGSLPRYVFGANFRMSYKNFDFSMVIQGVGKQNSRLEARMIRPLLANWGNIPAEIDEKYWSVYNSNEENLNATYPRLSWSASDANNYQMSDYWLINGGYLRMKNITLGYNFPKQMTQKINIDELRIYTSISDLFTIDNYLKGWDPEVASTGYPITTSYVFGLSVTF